MSKQETPKQQFHYSLRGIKIKEENGEFYSEGFIASTHPDRAADESLGVDGDIFSKHACQQIVDYINGGVATILGVGSTRAVSEQHDWIKEGNANVEPAGMVIPPAELRPMDEGHWGVYAKTHHNKSHPEFENIKYKVENGYYPGYSIEYLPGESSIVSLDGKTFRFMKTIANYVGHAFASARLIANPAALITSIGYKEIEQGANHTKNKEAKIMSEEPKTILIKELVELDKTLDVKELEKKEVKELEAMKAATLEAKSKETIAATVKTILDKKEADAKTAADAKDKKSLEDKTVSTKELVDGIMDSKEMKKTLEELKVESKVMNQKGDAQMNINIKQMNEALTKGDVVSAKEACLSFAEESNILYKAMEDPKSYTTGFKLTLGVKCIGKGLRLSPALQTKDTLVIGDNASSYTQQNVELADVFAPGIIDTFNNQTNLFGFLKKEPHVGGAHYQWKMVTNKNPKSNSTFVAQTDVNVIKNFSSKLNYQTPLKIARRGVSVSDFINRYSAKSLPDLFMLELDLQMLEMMNDVNAALFAEVADGTGNSPLGLEAVADSAGNTTIYGVSRSTANRLSPDSASDTYVAVGGSLTEALMRTKRSYMETQGSKLGDIAIIASPTTRDLILNLLDGQRRFNTVDAKFGFDIVNQVPIWDGTPIISDADCNSDALYFIDTSSQGDVIIVGMAPQIVQLAKVGAAVEAYVQMDFSHVYKQPRRIGMLDTLS